MRTSAPATNKGLESDDEDSALEGAHRTAGSGKRRADLCLPVRLRAVAPDTVSHADAQRQSAPCHPRARSCFIPSQQPRSAPQQQPRTLQQPAGVVLYPCPALTAPLSGMLRLTSLPLPGRSARASSSTGALSEPSFRPPETPVLWGRQHSQQRLAPSMQARRVLASSMLFLIRRLGLARPSVSSSLHAVQVLDAKGRQADASSSDRDSSPLSMLGRALSSKCGAWLLTSLLQHQCTPTDASCTLSSCSRCDTMQPQRCLKCARDTPLVPV